MNTAQQGLDAHHSPASNHHAQAPGTAAVTMTPDAARCAPAPMPCRTSSGSATVLTATNATTRPAVQRRGQRPEHPRQRRRRNRCCWPVGVEPWPVQRGRQPRPPRVAPVTAALVQDAVPARRHPIPAELPRQLSDGASRAAVTSTSHRHRTGPGSGSPNSCPSSPPGPAQPISHAGPAKAAKRLPFQEVAAICAASEAASEAIRLPRLSGRSPRATAVSTRSRTSRKSCLSEHGRAATAWLSRGRHG